MCYQKKKKNSNVSKSEPKTRFTVYKIECSGPVDTKMIHRIHTDNKKPCSTKIFSNSNFKTHVSKGTHVCFSLLGLIGTMVHNNTEEKKECSGYKLVAFRFIYLFNLFTCIWINFFLLIY